MLKVIAISLLFNGGNIAINNVSNFMPYTDYRCITSPTSIQYKMQQEAKTNDQGLRVLDDKCMVALYKEPETKKEPEKVKEPEQVKEPEKKQEPEYLAQDDTLSNVIIAPAIDEKELEKNITVKPITGLRRSSKKVDKPVKVNDSGNKYNLGDVLTLNINGQTYDVIVSDVRTTPNTENVIEFIVDTDKLSKEVKRSGSCLSIFNVNNYFVDVNNNFVDENNYFVNENNYFKSGASR